MRDDALVHVASTVRRNGRPSSAAPPAPRSEGAPGARKALCWEKTSPSKMWISATAVFATRSRM